MAIKKGGAILGVDVRPLPSTLSEMWKTMDQNWNIYKASLSREIMIPEHRTGLTDQPLGEKGFESLAYNLVNSSDKLVTQLGTQTDKNSQNLIQLQILFAVLIVGILLLILYLVARMLKPIFDLIHATSKVKKEILI